MKPNGHSKTKAAKPPAFVLRADRAFRRVAVQVRAEHAKFDLPLIGGSKSKSRLVCVKFMRVFNRPITLKDAWAKEVQRS